MKVKSESEDAQSCPTLSDHMDCSLPGSSVHGIFQARVLEWGAITFSVISSYYILIHCFCFINYNVITIFVLIIILIAWVLWNYVNCFF